MKTIFITGNGFNYMINKWIENFPDNQIADLNIGTKQDIQNEIEEITVLWRKFNEIFEEIKTNNPNLTEEELIRIIYSVIDLFSNLPGLLKIMSAEQITGLKELFSSFLLDKIKEIANDFRRHHESTGYKKLKKLFPDFGAQVNQIIDSKGSESFNVFTTNYDGLLDTLLTGNPYGFIFQDGFSLYDQSLLKLDERYVNFNKLICHIHGSYLYTKQFGYTYKLRSNLENTDPIMVFNNPDLKEEIIGRDNVLSRYYSLLIENLKVADNLIIFGNSMKNEPHLKKMINQYGDRESLNVYVCSTNPINIENEIKTSYHHNINLVNTSTFNSQQEFLDFLERII